jgi:hypothetical protein
VRPFALADVLAVVGSRRALGRPFLLEESTASTEFAKARKVVQIVLVPCWADFLWERERERESQSCGVLRVDLCVGTRER